MATIEEFEEEVKTLRRELGKAEEVNAQLTVLVEGEAMSSRLAKVLVESDATKTIDIHAKAIGNGAPELVTRGPSGNVVHLAVIHAGQVFTHFPVIVMIDGSTFGSAAIMADYLDETANSLEKCVARLRDNAAELRERAQR